MTKRYSAALFVDGSYGGAAGKARTTNAILKFIDSGFDRDLFTRQVYSGGLMYMFGHIAHYNQSGFFSTWFDSDSDILNWLVYVSEARLYGDADCTLIEVERIVQKFVRDSGLIALYEGRIARAQEEAERAQLAALKAKYEGSDGDGLFLSTAEREALRNAPAKARKE